jgi:hypothetical protein
MTDFFGEYYDGQTPCPGCGEIGGAHKHDCPNPIPLSTHAEAFPNGAPPDREEHITVSCVTCGAEVYRSPAHHRRNERQRHAGYRGAAKKAMARHTAETGHTDVAMGGHLVEPPTSPSPAVRRRARRRDSPTT